DGKMHDVNILDQLVPEAGAFYVMDRGYLDFERLAHLDDAGSFFVTRAKSNLKARRAHRPRPPNGLEPFNLISSPGSIAWCVRGCAAVQQIADWLEKLGMSEYAQRFAENDIDTSILGHLTDQDL